MTIGTILQYGLFNSRKNYKNLKVSPLRTVQCFEFDYILSCDKNAISHIDGKSCRLCPNMLVLRKPGQTSNSDLHFKCYCLHLKIDETSPFFELLFHAPDYFALISEEAYQTLFESLFRHLIKYPNEKNDYFVAAKLLELFYHIERDGARNKSEKNASVKALKKENRSVQKAISFMKKSYGENVTLEELGKLTGYSPNHFQRIFLISTGLSPQRYLEKVRIEQAKYLLAQNERSVADISYECGFSSQSYFSKIFKKHVLLTPCEYREKAAFRHIRKE